MRYKQKKSWRGRRWWERPGVSSSYPNGENEKYRKNAVHWQHLRRSILVSHWRGRCNRFSVLPCVDININTVITATMRRAYHVILEERENITRHSKMFCRVGRRPWTG